MNNRVIACVKPFGSEVLCSSCLTHRAGRVYDLRVTILDTPTGTADGVITLCAKCREDFNTADLELDSEAMFQDSERRRHEEQDEEAEHMSPFVRKVEHTTFPPGPVHNKVKG